MKQRPRTASGELRGRSRRGDGSPGRPKGGEFSRDFPEDPELARLVAAFDRGDYRLVRRDAPKLASSAPQPRVRRAAEELLRRIDPDPLAVTLIVVPVVLLLFLVFWTYAFHQHH